jgi:hypothetical protein
MLLAAWRTNNRVTVFLFEHLAPELWGATVPGAPRRTVRMIAGHIHNARCMWIKTLGKEHGIAVPRAVNRHKVGPKNRSEWGRIFAIYNLVLTGWRISANCMSFFTHSSDRCRARVALII